MRVRLNGPEELTASGSTCRVLPASKAVVLFLRAVNRPPGGSAENNKECPVKGHPGRRRIPTALHELRGFPGKRKPPEGEPTPALATAEPPKWLDDTAIEVWNDVAPELVRLGLLTQVDRHALAGACRWWAVYRKLDASLRDETVEVSQSQGRKFRIAQQAFASAMTVFARFGVTPSERARLTMPTVPADDDEAEQLLRQLERKPIC